MHHFRLRLWLFLHRRDLIASQSFLGMCQLLFKPWFCQSLFRPWFLSHCWHPGFASHFWHPSFVKSLLTTLFVSYFWQPGLSVTVLTPWFVSYFWHPDLAQSPLTPWFCTLGLVTLFPSLLTSTGNTMVWQFPYILIPPHNLLISIYLQRQGFVFSNFVALINFPLSHSLPSSSGTWPSWMS